MSDEETTIVTSAEDNIHTSGGIPSCVYSGADIKLVVHMPAIDESGDDVDEELAEAREEFDRIQDAIEAAGSEDATTQLERRLVDLQSQLEELTSLAETLSFLDDEEEEEGDGDEEAEDEEAEDDEEGGDEEEDDEAEETASAISEIEAEISEVESILQSASDESLEDLREQQTELARQITELEVQASGPRVVTKTLAEITTLSISTHREKSQVRTLGSVYPRGITRGPRTISGSVVFTTFYQHVFHEFFEAMAHRSTGVGDWDRFRLTTYLTDQLPPLDISIVFANEYGNMSWMALLGVEFLNEGLVMSIEDLFVEGTAQYIARDYDPIRNVGHRGLVRNRGVGSALTGSSVLMEDVRRRSHGRRNTFI